MQFTCGRKRQRREISADRAGRGHYAIRETRKLLLQCARNQVWRASTRLVVVTATVRPVLAGAHVAKEALRTATSTDWSAHGKCKWAYEDGLPGEALAVERTVTARGGPALPRRCRTLVEPSR